MVLDPGNPTAYAVARVFAKVINRVAAELSKDIDPQQVERYVTRIRNRLWEDRADIEERMTEPYTGEHASLEMETDEIVLEIIILLYAFLDSGQDRDVVELVNRLPDED